MKRILAIVLALCLMVSLCAGCSSTATEDGPVTVSYTHLDVYKRQRSGGKAADLGAVHLAHAGAEH